MGTLTLILLLLISALLSVNCLELTLSLKEELPQGHAVTTLSSLPQVQNLLPQNLQPASIPRFTLLRSTAPVFNVTNSSGQIVICDRVDRESLCGQLSQDCMVTSDVLLQYEHIFTVIKVHVIIEDIDDNSPVFLATAATVNFTESAAINSTRRLPAAVDADSDFHRNITYQLSPDISPFNIAIQDGQPFLVLQQSLDAENINRIQLELTAISAKHPNDIAVLTLDVYVLDENDNGPSFVQSTYQVVLPEDQAAGAIIAKVKAIDLDVETPNNQIFYEMEEENGVFSVDELTGEVYLDAPLDFEAVSSYTLTIEAQDSGPLSLTAVCQLLVTVTDVNDHIPVIAVTVIADEPQVEEHSEIGTFVAHVSVSDGDKDSAVTCMLDDENFLLSPLYESEWMLVVNSDLDRELSGAVTVTIRCTDNGVPSKSSQLTIQVVLLDINDHSPAFERQTYDVHHLMENQEPGSFVIGLTVDDPDTDINSKVTFSLNDDVTSEFFTIDKNTGEIRTMSSIDFELTPELILTAIATDCGVPPLSSTATVHIHIVDVNDNKPVFTQPSYELSVEEEDNSAVVVIGEVSATDFDQRGDEYIWYRLKGEDSTLFTISYSTGVITTTQHLDREVQSTYMFSVVATDFGLPALSSEVSVSIEVTDINDHIPEFNTATNSTFSISLRDNPGDTITVIKASDADSTDHGNLKYGIVQGPTFVAIDVKTGRLYTTQRLQQTDVGIHPLVISVSDLADHISLLKVTLEVTHSLREFSRYGSGGISGIIIGFLSSLMVIVTLLAVIAYIKVRKEKHSNSHKYNCRKATESRVSSLLTSYSSRTCSTSDYFSSLYADRIRGQTLCCETDRNIPSPGGGTSTYVQNSLIGSFSVQNSPNDSGCGSIDTSAKRFSPVSSSTNRMNDSIGIDKKAAPSVHNVETYPSDIVGALPLALDQSIRYADEDVYDLSLSLSDENEVVDSNIINCVICLNNSDVSWSHTHDDNGEFFDQNV